MPFATVSGRLPGICTIIWLVIIILAFISSSFIFSSNSSSPSPPDHHVRPFSPVPGEDRASTPPRGWNSYDSFSWIIAEDEFLDNAGLLAHKLLPLGYEYAVLDFLWYRKLVPGASVGSPGFDLIDEWGRPVPDPVRWPSSAKGEGLKAVADRVHEMGLKFGLHVMRGISAQAVDANTPILGPQGLPYEENGKVWRARDIAIQSRRCGWMPKCFMSVNTNVEAGRAFLRSLYTQYAQWGVDLVKNDCVFGDDLDVDEISTVSQILRELQRPILYSLSPGTHATPNMAIKINNLVNMYRVTGDDWDTWNDVQSHFDVARDFASSGLIGAKGLLGQSWPDLDMLPLGWLTDPGANQGPHRPCALTYEEQKTQITLWAMAKSPLMFGGDLRNVDDKTMSLLTNPTMLAINSYSTNNREFSQISFVRVSTRSKLNERQDSNSDSKLFLKIWSCHEKNIKNWTIGTTKEKKEICWNDNVAMGSESKMCLHSRVRSNDSLVPESGGGQNLRLKYKENSRQSHLRLLSIIDEVCLDSSPSKRLTLDHIETNNLAPCNDHASQKWELSPDGGLHSSYTGLCASVSNTKVWNWKQVPQARAWIANGSSGQVYVALFNLDTVTLKISIKVDDINNTSQNEEITTNNAKNCTGFEVWSGQDLGVVGDKIAIDVVSHGCALIVLTCN